MSAHLKQTICRVSQIGHELAQQTTGDDLSDLCKAQLLGKLIYEVKEMLGYAVDSLNVDDKTFVYLKERINTIDEDGELKEVIEELDESTDEPPYDLHKEEGHTMQNTGCVPFIRR